MPKHFYLKGLTAKEIQAKLDSIHGTSVPVYNYIYESKSGGTSTQDFNDIVSTLIFFLTPGIA